MPDIWAGGNRMCCNMNSRGFWTKEEKVEMLKEYQSQLEKEAQGVRERIQDLEKAN